MLLLVGGAIGLAVLLELWTFGGRLWDRMTPRTDPSPVPAGERPSAVDLPGTPARESLVEAAVTAEGTIWTFHLALEVDNDTPRSYRLRLEALRFTNRRVRSRSGWRRVPPGTRRRIRFTRRIPPGTTPVGADVTAVLTGPEGRSDTVTGTVRPGKVPVLGS